MLTEKDIKILSFIEKYNLITINQCSKLFFNGTKQNAWKKMKLLEERNLVEKYIFKGDRETFYKIPFGIKKDKHYSYILDFYVWLDENKYEIVDFQVFPKLFDNGIQPDALIKCIDKNNYIYFFLLEIDFGHTTDNIRLNKQYESLYNSKKMEEYCEEKNGFPIVIISKPNPDIRYSSKNFDVLYTDLKFKNLQQLIDGLFR